jgi:flagellar biosynthetic protein FliR
MSLDQLLQFVPAYVLAFFRLAGMMAFAPLFGSSRIPKRVKVYMAAILATAVVGGLSKPVAMPQSLWTLAVGIGGELMFGVAMGMAMSFSFFAVQWAGEMIGQQMGLSAGSVFDPQFGGQSTVIGDLYFMLTLVIFLLINGHHAMLLGVRDSFTALPLLSLSINQSVINLMVGLLQACTILAVRLAAPMLVTMLVVEVALGFISKTMPQFNVMTAGLSLRSAIGLVVLIVGISLSSGVIRDALLNAMQTVRVAWGG